MSESNERKDEDRPRQPRSLQGLLKFAMEGKNFIRLQNYNNNFKTI
jgi:hypothetical protein